MDIIEIILFLLGAVFFILSFLVGNGKDAKRATEVNTGMTEGEIEAVRQRITESINETADRVIDEAESRLNTLSNKTILSVDDFSKQTLDRISHNHEEVVFMYHMLQTKEDELKRTVTELDSQKKKVQDEVIPPMQIPEESGIEIARKKAQAGNVKKSGQSNQQRQISGQITRKTMKAEARNQNDIIAPEPELPEGDEENKNQKIIELYRQKKTVLEISKQLGLGQGEVKLVIDLYGR